jgi:hypothetical protein
MRKDYWNEQDKESAIKEMIGHTFTSVINDGDLIFKSSDGTTFTFYHDQECCEQVSIESITGDLSDLVGHPLLVAEESTSDTNPEDVKREDQDCFTWTFYKFATIKGHVDVRWYGESNGYYSTSVTLGISRP